MNWPFPSAAENREALRTEIAEMTGERYTVVAHLQWIDNKLEALQKHLSATYDPKQE